MLAENHKSGREGIEKLLIPALRGIDEGDRMSRHGEMAAKGFKRREITVRGENLTLLSILRLALYVQGLPEGVGGGMKRRVGSDGNIDRLRVHEH